VCVIIAWLMCACDAGHMCCADSYCLSSAVCGIGHSIESLIVSAMLRNRWMRWNISSLTYSVCIRSLPISKHLFLDKFLMSKWTSLLCGKISLCMHSNWQFSQILSFVHDSVHIFWRIFAIFETDTLPNLQDQVCIFETSSLCMRGCWRSTFLMLYTVATSRKWHFSSDLQILWTGVKCDIMYMQNMIMFVYFLANWK